jgi:hypothetical protein
MYTSRCINIGRYREIERAGHFIIGQSHLVNYSVNSHINNDTSHQNENFLLFDEHDSFIGSLFNFNIWNYYQNAESIYRIYEDCGLIHCGNGKINLIYY